ncbi:MAG TPA: protein kinase [Gemmatimonadales bacterium]|nr:protein kinase [Gemmatimonadales bacterium]
MVVAPLALAEALRDRYTIEREVGRGGMATVYLAHDLRHDRPVALKVLHPDLAATLGPERFQREIRTTARLQHPHILPVLDSGEAAAQLWYTMPYVEGESLRDRLRRESQLPLDDALQITREVADALSYAHSQGIVHRDIKPGNILLSRGHALVADFGIARALQVADTEQLTATGMAVGTPAYMSPEQAGGTSSVDGRSDLYSLGCVLYEMLTGEVPYTARTPQAVIAKRVIEPLPRVRTLRQSVPESVEQAINRALAVAPADRFPTAAEFARAITQPLLTRDTTTASAWQRMAVRGWRLRGLATLALGIVLVGGVLLAWLRARPEPGAAGPKRLAVLPFENLGQRDDDYFADGVTNEVRGKLAALPGLEVIARTSSVQYKQTTKSPQQIGRELGVQYLLTGTVRWEKAKPSGGTSRVRVSPELIQVTTASTKWQAPFEAPLTDVFQVQGQIAGRVAEALGVALGAGEQERIRERPTQNLAAYDAFLRGEQAADGLASLDQAALRRARDYYQRAVTLDSSFALAWAQLSRAYSFLYWSATDSAAAMAAQRAAERSLTLAPKGADGYLALGNYYEMVRYDAPRALEQYTKGRQLAPKDARLLAWAGWGEFLLRRVDEGIAHMREAEVLDPRRVEIAHSLTWPLLTRRRYAEALSTAERARALAPSNLWVIVTLISAHLAQGDLAGARSVLRAVPVDVDTAALVAQVAMADLYWVLDDEQQQQLLRLSPEPFGGNRAAWGLALAQTNALRGAQALARAYADSARVAFEARLRDVPEDAPTHAYLGLALAYLGRRAEAVHEGERGVELLPISRNVQGADLQRVLALTHLIVGESEQALGLLESLLKVPYWFSPGWLKIDPNFAPLRGNPRFEKLVAAR